MYYLCLFPLSFSSSSSFFFAPAYLRYLHSFPTRRSSDLLMAQVVAVEAQGGHRELLGGGLVDGGEPVAPGRCAQRRLLGGSEVEHPQQLRHVDVLGCQPTS